MGLVIAISSRSVKREETEGVKKLCHVFGKRVEEVGVNCEFLLKAANRSSSLMKSGLPKYVYFVNHATEGIFRSLRNCELKDAGAG